MKDLQSACFQTYKDITPHSYNEIFDTFLFVTEKNVWDSLKFSAITKIIEVKIISSFASHYLFIFI